uniref:Uncharacterized protein n=1 Tax=Sphaerodactylus townsendi TaxID=933632 RepID=A0ACB8F0S1_9SAUR
MEIQHPAHPSGAFGFTQGADLSSGKLSQRFLGAAFFQGLAGQSGVRDLLNVESQSAAEDHRGSLGRTIVDLGSLPTVQEERQRGKDRNENEVESTSNANEDMPVEKILEAELAVEPKTETYIEANMGLTPNSPNDPVTNICQAADKQLFTLVEWAKRIPHFSELPLDDQVILLRAGWNELLIASFSHRSIAVKDGILLATGLHVHRNSAHSAGVGAIFDRVLTELVSKMRDMQMDKTELGCLRAIVLFNPGRVILLAAVAAFSRPVMESPGIPLGLLF